MSVFYRGKTRRRRRSLRRGKLIVSALILAIVAGLFVFFWPEQAPKISYPMAYEAEIRERSLEFGLDPARVAAVIYCESSFRPEVVSEAGARGLMQIMPTTAEWLATKFEDIEYESTEQLFDPVVNMRFGCWYLNYLDGRFSNDLRLATAAYHTGQGNVDAWLEDEAHSADGVTLDVIPSAVTNTYVNRVTAAYEAYKELYQDAQTN